MGERASDEVVEALQNEFGDALRSVMCYDREGYEIRYIRDDVERKYTEEMRERIGEETRLEALQSSYICDLFSTVHGEFDCSVRVFEEGIELNCPFSETKGVAIGVDRDEDDERDRLSSRVRDALADVES